MSNKPWGGFAAVVFLTAGLLAGCSDESEPPVGAPNSASAPAPTTEAAATSVPATATPRALVLPKSIPATAFLQATDVPGKAKEKPSQLGAGDQPLPAFCAKDYEQKNTIGVRGTQSIIFGSKDAPADAIPNGTVYEDVIVYRGSGATAFMTDLRAAVKGCATEKDDSGVALTNYLRGPIDAGDDSELIEQTRPAYNEDGTPVGDGSVHRKLWVAVRVGDTIGFVADIGWESVSAEKNDAVSLGRNAAKRIEAWRK